MLQKEALSATENPSVEMLMEAAAYVHKLSSTFMYFNWLTKQPIEYLKKKAVGTGTVALLCNWAIAVNEYGLDYALTEEKSFKQKVQKDGTRRLPRK